MLAIRSMRIWGENRAHEYQEKEKKKKNDDVASGNEWPEADFLSSSTLVVICDPQQLLHKGILKAPQALRMHTFFCSTTWTYLGNDH